MFGGSPHGPTGLWGRDERGTVADETPITLKTVAESYLRAKALSRATRYEYLSTLRKWERWGVGSRRSCERGTASARAVGDD
jgi:hypothetical protein